MLTDLLPPDAIEGIHYVVSNGRAFPIVRGGDGDDDTGDDTSTGDSDNGADGDGNQDGDDGSDQGGDDTGSSDTDEPKWKALARKHEKAWKAEKAAHDKLKRSQLSDHEQAIADAKDQGRAEARAEVAREIVAAKLEAAGVPDEDVADLDLSKFLDEDGKVDTDKVKATGERWKKRTTTTGSADGGPQGGDKPTKPTTLEGAVAAHMSGA